MVKPQTKPVTVEEFAAMDLSAPGRYDLIDGEVVALSPTGEEHGAAGGWLAVLIGSHARRTGAGRVYVAEAGFEVVPGQVVCPDVAFVAAERLAAVRDRSRFVPFAPDLAVEIVSPSDRPGLVEAKVGKYLVAGTPLVWVAYPRRRAVVAHQPGEPPRTSPEGEEIEGEPVLPELRIPLAALFRDA